MVMQFLVLNIFISVLNDSLHQIQGDETLKPRDYEVMEYLIGMVKALVKQKSLKSTASDRGTPKERIESESTFPSCLI